MSAAIVLTLVLMGPGLADVDARVRETLDDPRFAFCHDEAYPLSDDEARWCPWLEGGTPRCPAFAATCDAPRAEMIGPPGGRSIRTRGQRADDRDEAEAGSRESAPKPSAKSDRETWTLPNFGWPAQVLFWTIIGGAALALGLSIRRNIATGVPEPDAEPDLDDELDRRREAADLVSQRAMETDVDRLIGLAERAAERDEYDAAVDYSHAALLRRLDHDSLIRLHRSRTNGDYVRQLREHPTIQRPVREALRLVDAAQFDDEPTSRGTFQEILAKVRAIATRSGPLAIALALLAAGGIACEPLAKAIYPWSVSPSGFAAIVELMQRRGVDVQVHSRPDFAVTDDGAPRVPATVLLEGVELDDETWSAAAQWLDAGGHLIVAGAETPPWLGVAAVDDDPRGAAQPVTEPGWDGTSPAGVMLTLPANGGVFGLSPTDVFLARGDTAYAGYVPHGAGGIVVLGSDALFCNASMAVSVNAEYAVDLLEYQGEAAHLVTGDEAGGPSSPLEGIIRTHLTAAVVQLGLFLVAFYAWRGVRFGSGRDPRTRTRRRFDQHARALGRQYERANAQRHAAAAYSHWALERLRARFPAEATRGLQGLAEACARQTSRDETDLVRLLVRAHGAATDQPTDDSESGVSIIRELGQLLRAIGRPR